MHLADLLVSLSKYVKPILLLLFLITSRPPLNAIFLSSKTLSFNNNAGLLPTQRKEDTGETVDAEGGYEPVAIIDWRNTPPPPLPPSTKKAPSPQLNKPPEDIEVEVEVEEATEIAATM